MSDYLTMHSPARVLRSMLPWAGPVLAACLLVLLPQYAEAAKKKKDVPVEEVKEMVWPPPPSEPVIRYEREFRSELDLQKKKKKSSWKDALLGKEDDPTQILRTPYNVHIDKAGRVLVADGGLPGLAVFDFENRSFSLIGATEPGALSKAMSVTTDHFGRIYVTDGEAQAVMVYDQNGAFLNRLGRNDEFERPVGIAVDDQRERVYVSDALKHHIVVFDFDGQRISIMGERGVEPGTFNFPTNLAIDSSGRLHVVDSMNFRIQVFEPDNGEITIISEQGTGFGHLSRPRGVAVDSMGNVYVSDAAFNNVQMFSRDGALLMFFGESGPGPGGFNLPAGLAVDAQDRIYLADQGNRRIQVFQFLGKPELEEAEKAGAEP